MTTKDYIVIIHNDFIFKIDKEPFETDEDTFKRGWFIIGKNPKIINDEIISKSIIYLNETKNKMKYT